jgi:uncharacterized protein YjdB
MKKLLLLLAISFLVFSACSTGDNSSGTEKVTALALYWNDYPVPEELSLAVGGEKITIIAKTRPLDAAVTWETSSVAIATVSNGTVTGVSAGIATITATAGNIKKECTVKVTGSGGPITPGDGITLNKSTLALAVGGSETLTATTVPAGATVTWSTSNAAAATVNNGTVSAVAAGTANITATAGGKSATCVVTVTASGGPVTPGDPGISLDKTSIVLIPQETKIIVASVEPAGSAVTWTTSSASVATVNNGTVSAVAAGTATITATAGGKSATCTVKVTTAAAMTSADYFQWKGLHLGWNLGNALDSSATSETGWGNPTITSSIFTGIKAAGFNVVRIPVTWGSPGNAPYTANTARLNRLAEVVNMAKAAGLVAIINIHHDGDSSNGSHWLNIEKARDSTAQRTAITAQYKWLWEQIANHFKNFGDELIFEPFNEIHDGGWGSNTISQTEADIINDWNQQFTNVVRASGGNNATRYLIVKPYCAKLNQARDERFKLPTDTASNRQIVSFHYYEPQDFALNGSDPNWSESASGGLMRTAFSRMKSSFVDQGIAVIIGESGATFQNRSGTAGDTANANRIAYFSYLTSTAKANGLTPVYWDNGRNSGGGNGEMFGLFNRNTGQPNSDHSRACIEAMVNGVK